MSMTSECMSSVELTSDMGVVHRLHRGYQRGPGTGGNATSNADPASEALLKVRTFTNFHTSVLASIYLYISGCIEHKQRPPA